MPQIRVFQATLNGFVEYTGNTLGITTVTSSAAIAINALLQATPAPPGGTVTTLNNWTNASASAFLTGLAGSTVVKAYLMWSGQPVPDTNGTQAAQNNAVLFTDPTGTTTSISPNATWSQTTVFGGSLVWITKVQEVTSIVATAGTGKYTVARIPSGANFTGWTLAVVWSNNAFPPRFITVDSYDDINNNTGLNLSLTGFITPASGTVSGRAAMTVSGAESNTAGGGVKFGRSVATLTSLSGPRNPVANFFQCQINDSNSESPTVGQLDQTGTWGTQNTPLNSNPAVNSRWHFDQTNVDISAGLINNQTAGVFQFAPAPSPYIINLISLQIDAQAPSFAPTKAVDKTSAEIGETLTYTLVFTNSGNNATANGIVVDTIPTGLTFSPGSIVLNGVAQPVATITPPSGFNVGAIAIGATNTIVFKARVNNVPLGTLITNSYGLGYNYNPINAPTLSLSNNIQSNSVNTTVLGTVTITNTKTVNKAFANINDTLTYTAVLKVNGNTSATSVVFLDTIPNGTTFVTNSFAVNGVTIAGANPSPPTGVNLGTIPNGTTQTITFNVVVNTIPSPNPIPNTESVSYLYTIDPSTPNGGSGGQSSNTVTTQVNNANLGGISKRVDKAFAKVGDTLLYKVVIPNSGNASAINVVLKDTIPNNTAFQANSVTINGVVQNGAVVAPPTGLTIGTIPGGSVTTVTFIVSVSTIPTPNPIPNNATMTYSYVIDPSVGTTATGSANTNTVTTQVNTALVGTTKTVSAANVFVGDTVTYTMVLRNTGNTTANSVLLTDTIPNGGTFVADSVTVNGTTQTGINPQTNGVVVPTLPIGGVATVTFKVILDTTPTPNPTPNTAVTSYQYLLDPSTPINQSVTGSSNTVTTFVNPNANPLKVVNKTSATVGDTLVYFIQWMNVTNGTQTNVIILDTLPNGVTFVPNSVTINGVNQPGATITPPNGINTGTLPLESTVSVTYQVIINTIPSPEPIPNTASVTNTGINGTQTAETNQVLTEVNFAEITRAPKTVDKAFSTVGETITYTIALFNNGNTSANNVVITDTIPSGTTFVVNSVTVNGVSQPGAVIAPTTGLTLSCIPAGTTTTITFEVLVQSIPTPNPTPNTATATYTFEVNHETGQTQSGNINTNTVTTTIVDATIVSTKVVSKSFAQLGDTLTYTIVLVATGNTTANNAVFVDSLPSTLTYVPGTFAINGSLVSGANPAPPGQSIGSLTIPATYTITFNAVVNTIPTTNPIQNQAQTNYAYRVEPTLANSRTRGTTTNIANTTVSQASLGGIIKAADKVFADCGDTITYTVVIPNSGNTAATNVVFKDTIPNGTVLVPDSVTLNGATQTGVSPQTGVAIGTIASGGVATIQFKVRVQC